MWAAALHKRRSTSRSKTKGWRKGARVLPNVVRWVLERQEVFSRELLIRLSAQPGEQVPPLPPCPSRSLVVIVTPMKTPAELWSPNPSPPSLHQMEKEQIFGVPPKMEKQISEPSDSRRPGSSGLHQKPRAEVGFPPSPPAFYPLRAQEHLHPSLTPPALLPLHPGLVFLTLVSTSWCSSPNNAKAEDASGRLCKGG